MLLMMFVMNGVVSRVLMLVMILFSFVELRIDVIGEVSLFIVLGRLLIRFVMFIWLMVVVVVVELIVVDWVVSLFGLVVCDGGFNGCSILVVFEVVV